MTGDLPEALSFLDRTERELPGSVAQGAAAAEWLFMSDIGGLLPISQYGEDRVAVLTLFLDFRPDIVKHQEPVGVQALRPKLAAEGFDEPIVRWPSRL